MNDVELHFKNDTFFHFLQILISCNENFSKCALLNRRLPSRGLESETAGLRSLWLASRLKPWLRTTDGLGKLMAASHGLQMQTCQ